MPKRPMPDLRKSSGAFDLPSIITGVVVVGILAAGVLAAIFGVIPFAQDRGAKQDLSSIRTAEGVAKAKDNRFLDHTGLLDTGYLQPSSTEKTTVKADAKGTCYVGLAKSGTGKIFYSTDAKTDPEVFEADTDTGCLTSEELAELIEEVGGIEEGVANNSTLKLVAVSALEAQATWLPVKGAVGYKVEYQVNGGAWATKSGSTDATSETLNAMPEDTINVRVTTLRDGDPAEPMLATVKLPDSVLKNPSFEQGSTGWTLAGSIAPRPHTGGNSADVGSATQVITVPQGTPVLSFWWQGAGAYSPTVYDGDAVIPSTPSGAVSGSWGEYVADLSAYAGKTITLKIGGRGWLDDVSLTKPVAPTAPLSVSAISQSNTATVSWAAPAFSGGGIPVTSYTATAFSGTQIISSVKVNGDLRAATFTGLDAGSKYTFKVTATNQAGDSLASAAFGPVTINSGPIANPDFENGTAGWTMGKAGSNAHSGWGSADMGAVSQVISVPRDTPVLSFWKWTAHAAAVSVDGTVVPHVPTGAVSGTWGEYVADLSSFTGKTVTLKISGGYYLDDVSLTKPVAPTAPLSVSAISQSNTATVSWAAPAFSGGGVPVTSYTATAFSGAQIISSVKVNGDLRAATFTGLDAGSRYTFKVTATNQAGDSPTAAFGPVTINSGPIANPGFEDGTAGWTMGKTGIVAHSGNLSADMGVASQVITVPRDTPVLSFWKWTAHAAVVSVDGTVVPHVPTGAVSGSWGEYRADLSAYAGKTVTLKISGGFYLDDVSLTKPVAPSVPLSVSAISKSNTATVSWAAPAFSGGGVPVTSYTATAFSGAQIISSVKVDGDLRAATFTGLDAGSKYTFRVTATNQAGDSPTAAFGPVTIISGPIANPGFESGTAGWTMGKTGTVAHSGNLSADMGVASQVITVPRGTPVLSFWKWTAHAAVVSVGGTVVPHAPTGAVSGSWGEYRADLSAYAGKTVTLQINGGWFLDDVALN